MAGKVAQSMAFRRSVKTQVHYILETDCALPNLVSQSVVSRGALRSSLNKTPCLEKVKRKRWVQYFESCIVCTIMDIP